MMGSSMPSAQSLTDLAVLLQLLQAASDPATSKATLELFKAERKKYDDAIAEAGAAQRRALASIAEAAASKEAAEESIANAEVATAALAQREDALATEEERLNGVRVTLVNAKTALEAESKALTQRGSALEADIRSAQEGMAADRADIAVYQKKAQSNMDEALALKAEYEAKMAKIKALAE